MPLRSPQMSDRPNLKSRRASHSTAALFSSAELSIGAAHAVPNRTRRRDGIFQSAMATGVQNIPEQRTRSPLILSGWRRTSFSKRVIMGRDARRNYVVRLQHISDALIASGYTKLDEQAKALGVRRSAAWTIIKTKHKLGRDPTRRRSAFSQIPTPRHSAGLSFKNIWPKGPMFWHFVPRGWNRREHQSNKLRAVTN